MDFVIGKTTHIQSAHDTLCDKLDSMEKKNVTAWAKYMESHL